MGLQETVRTHVGYLRQLNEDSGEVIRHQQYLLAIVADGMGGHQAGDVASKMAIESIKDSFLQVDREMGAQEWAEWLQTAIEQANQVLYQYALDHPNCYGMGTTLVTFLALPDVYLIAHVGDSRAYRLNNEKLERLTEDHSLVFELLRSGQITEEEALVHPQRNVITRALGTEPNVEVDIETYSYQTEQFFLLCSDGLSNLVSDDVMLEILKQDHSLPDKADQLVNKALEAGGDDNITLILLQLDGEELC